MTLPHRPNVLLITADQWRGECLGVLGHMVRTPNLDALAADGALFARHYANAAPCGPSRACLLTGMYLMNHRSGTNGTPLDARFTNIALEARKLGYAPGLFGYTDTSADPRELALTDPALETYEGIMRGFDPVCHLPGHEGNWLKWLRSIGYDVPPDLGIYFPVDGYPGAEGKGPSYPPPVYPAEHSDTAFLTNELLTHLDEQGDRPWFAHLSWLRPHPPWVAPEPYNTLYDADAVPGFIRRDSREEEGRQHPWLAFQAGRAGYRAPGSELVMRQFKATYYGLMTEVDHHLGRIVAWLKASGQWERTLIVFTSDHGEQMGDHWLLGKSGYFDQSFHIPLIIRDPRAEAARGMIVRHYTEAVDVMPTILAWLGLDSPMQCDGASLMPFLAGRPPAGWRDAVHWEYDFRDIRGAAPETELGLTVETSNLAVLADEHFKYVHFAGLPPLLFDRAADPHEFHDISAEPALAPVAARYARKMLSWRMALMDRTLSHWHLGDGGPVFRR
ncbi:sulfatase [Oleomonas cavernae]|uniref:Sulfatase n=1 Tax=Oleomonas cavernae TaxID=2320859 RepID=A0A418VUL4_9PROT|nr:alkaline phosphatase family protein [Oleomonas cavernae]RJF80823.1 sulfatase [Oleomonas cavernae]